MSKNSSKRKLPLQTWAKDHLSENGIIIYSTCSLLQIENKPLPELKIVEIREWDPQTGPHGDGIFAMILAP